MPTLLNEAARLAAVCGVIAAWITLIGVMM